MGTLNGHRADQASFVIVGAGSLGLSFAGALAAAGQRVTLLGRPTSVAAVLSAGEVQVEGELNCRVPVSAAPARPGVLGALDDPALLPAVDGTLFTTKGPQLGDAVRGVARAPAMRDSASWVAGFQNGVVKDDVLSAAVGPGRTLGAVTVLGARRLGAAKVLVSGLGMTYFGELDGPPTPRTWAACEALRQAGIPCQPVENVRSLLWSKFANAVGIFAVSALTGLSTGELFGERPLVRAYRSLLDEVSAVAQAEGVPMDDYPGLTMKSYLDGTADEFVDMIVARAVPFTGAPSYSSMAQDIGAGRPTEVEEIFGDLVRRGALHGVPTPRAELVRQLISGIDAAHAERPSLRPSGPGPT